MKQEVEPVNGATSGLPTSASWMPQVLWMRGVPQVLWTCGHAIRTVSVNERSYPSRPV
jgi:hypothetical protein